MKVSIILPVYNVAELLPKAITSIQKQSYNNFEAIFIDDGSTDNSLSIIEELTNGDKRFFVITQKNSGAGAARNKGLEFSTGEYIFFMDPDDSIKFNLLEDNIKKLKKHSPQVLLFGYETYKGDRLIKSTKNTSFKFYDNATDVSDNFAQIFSENDYELVWNKMYNADFLKKNNLIFSNLRTGQDSVFNAILFKYVTTLIINPNVYYNFLSQRKGSAQTKINPERIFDSVEALEYLEELFLYWGYNKKRDKFIKNKYIRLTFFQILNEIRFKKENKKTKKKIIFQYPTSFVKKYNFSVTENYKDFLKLLFIKIFFNTHPEKIME